MWKSHSPPTIRLTSRNAVSTLVKVVIVGPNELREVDL